MYDIKAFHEETHKRCTGYSNKQIIDNLLYLDKKGCKTEICIPIVPQFNDFEVEQIGELLSGLKYVTKIRVLAYHNYAGFKYASLGMENALPTASPQDSAKN